MLYTCLFASISFSLEVACSFQVIIPEMLVAAFPLITYAAG